MSQDPGRNPPHPEYGALARFTQSVQGGTAGQGNGARGEVRGRHLHILVVRLGVAGIRLSCRQQSDGQPLVAGQGKAPGVAEAAEGGVVGGRPESLVGGGEAEESQGGLVDAGHLAGTVQDQSGVGQGVE